MLEAEQKQQTVIAEIADDPDNEKALDNYKNKIVTAAVEKLPDMYKDTIILKYYYGLSISEIGAHTIIWDNGEYIFELSGTMSEAELMELYYTVK